MKKLVFSAAALTATSIAFANESDWAQLDQDIQALSASLQGMEDTGMTIGGRLRWAYENSGDIVGFDADGNLATTNDQADLGGFNHYNTRLYATGTTRKGLGYRLEIDPVRGGIGNGLVEAWIDVPIGNDITFRSGAIRPYVLRESQINSGDLMFFDRSVPAMAFSGRQLGGSFRGNFEAFDWAVSIMNGQDGVGDDLFYSLHGEMDIIGEGTDLIEGSYGASEEMEATVGLSYFNDDAVDDADGFALEGSIASSQFSASATIVSFGDGYSNAVAENNERTFLGAMNLADSTVFSLAGTIMISEADSEYGAWELGARFQDLDDANETTVLDLGANYYADGHDMKYIIGFTQTSSDLDALEVSLFRLGIQTRF